MKKFFALFATILIIISIFTFGASANFNSESITSDLSTSNYYMLSLDDNYELFSKGETDHVQPAAMNKVLAAVVAIEKWGNMDESVTITEDNLSEISSVSGVNKMGLTAGDTYTKLELVEAMLMMSYNDCEAVIAYEISGSCEKFATEMNTYAKSIGCNDTNVVSIYGFDEDGQYTCAKDVARIFYYGMKNSNFSDAIQLSSLTLPATTNSSEKTIQTQFAPSYTTSAYYHSSIKGGKYGETTQAGKCCAAVAIQDGYSYVAVAMNGTSDGTNNTAEADCKNMISWAFDNLSINTIVKEDQVVAELPLEGGKNTDKVTLVPSETVTALVLSSVSSDSVLVEIEDSSKDMTVTAPVAKGQYICKANVIYAGDTIATIDLVASTDISVSAGRKLADICTKVLSSGFVIFLEIVGLIVLLALLANYLWNHFSKQAEMQAIDKDGKPVGKQIKPKSLIQTIRDIITGWFEKIKPKFESLKSIKIPKKGAARNEKNK